MLCEFLGADLQSMCFFQISSVKFLQTAPQFIFIVDLNEVGQSKSGLSLIHKGSFKNCLNDKEQLTHQQGQLAFFKMFLKGLFVIQIVYIWNQKKCPFLLFLSKRPPSGWSVPDKLYFRAQTAENLPANAWCPSVGRGGLSGGQLLDSRETW